MFTGIVEEMGVVQSVQPQGQGAQIVIRSPQVLKGIRIGDSVAVNGTCLTVVEETGSDWRADAVEETLSRTNLGMLRAGDLVNLERPLKADGRLDGHLVQGHVDGVGTVVTPAPDLRVRVPRGLSRYIVEKGSITVDGTSLTVVDVDRDTFSVAIIPHTAEVTVLGSRQPGDRVNLEVDVVAKYVERLLTSGQQTPYGGSHPADHASAPSNEAQR